MSQILLDQMTQDQKIDAIFKSVEKTRKYFKWTLIITVVTIVLPLIGLMFVLPSFFSSMTGNLSGMMTGF